MQREGKSTTLSFTCPWRMVVLQLIFIMAHLGNTHFQKLFKAPPRATLTDIVQIVGHFNRFIGPNEVEELTSPITMGELESTLKWFKKDKSPRIDGWSVKFYLAFHETIGQVAMKNFPFQSHHLEDGLKYSGV